MKKSIALSIALAAIISATASAQVDFQVYPTTRCDVEVSRVPRPMPVADDDAQPEVINLAGTYVNGIKQTFTAYDPEMTPVGDNVARANDFTILADPETENGYIIRDFCKGMFFNAAQPGSVNEIKATFDPSTNILSILPGQPLFARQMGEYGLCDLLVLTPDDEGIFSPKVPVEFEFSMGTLNLKSKAIGFFAIVEMPDSPSGQGMIGPNVIVTDMIAWISNGEMTYFALPGQSEYIAPVFGVNVADRCYVYNFAGVDVFHPAVFEHYTGKVVSNGSEVAAVVTRYNAQTNVQTNNTYYLAATDIDNNYAPMGFGDHRFYVIGQIVADEPDEFAFELPVCGLYNEDGKYQGIYEGAYITYSREVTGIDAPAAVVTPSDAPVVYYNLQGMRVDNPQGGIFIRRQGNESTKILIK